MRRPGSADGPRRAKTPGARLDNERDIMSTTNTYHVSGMTCGGCAGKVTGQIEQIPGITGVDVDLATGGLTVTSNDPLGDDIVTQAIERAGYRLAR